MLLAQAAGSFTWQAFVIPAIPAFAVGLAVAYGTAQFTARHALRGFRSQRWWERKADAYTAVIEALHGMKRYSEYWWQVKTGEISARGDEYEERLRGQHRIARDEIDKALDVGSFLFSHEACGALATMQQGIEGAEDAERRSRDSFEYAEGCGEAAKACLAVLPALARKDLKVEEL